MSVALRIIPKLDIKGPNLVKGVHLEGLRVLGKPEVFAKYYYEQGADELFYQDVVASLYGRNCLHDIISKTAKEIFIPLTVGGGIRTIEDISNILRAGADKVSINTAAIENPKLITEASKIFGASTIVVSIEAIRQADGSYMAFTDNGRNRSRKEVVSWAKEVEELGGGEIVLTSVDREGSGEGFDINLIKQVAEAITLPIVVHGGAGNITHILDLLNKISVSGIAISSMFHYNTLKHFRDFEDFNKEGNLDFIKSMKGFSMIKDSSILEVKEVLNNNNIHCRNNA